MQAESNAADRLLCIQRKLLALKTTPSPARINVIKRLATVRTMCAEELRQLETQVVDYVMTYEQAASVPLLTGNPIVRRILAAVRSLTRA